METSGPWHVASHHGGAAITVETESGELIAQVYNEHVDAEANARLIAQSPAMLDQLRSTLEALRAAEAQINDQIARLNVSLNDLYRAAAEIDAVMESVGNP